MRLLIIGLMLMAIALLSGCGTINAGYSGALNATAQDYMGAKENIQHTDDFKLRAWLDSSCAINIGALQRAISTSGNPYIANAIFTACPVPGVGVSTTTATGSMQVQTFQLPSVVQGAAAAAQAPATEIAPIPPPVIASPQPISVPGPVPVSRVIKPRKTIRKPVAQPVTAPITRQPPRALPVAPIVPPAPIPAPVQPAAPSLGLPSALP